LLVDIHPEPGRRSIEVRRGHESFPVGLTAERASIAKILHARAMLGVAVTEGRFRREQATTFVFLSHFTTVEQLLLYRAEHSPSLVLDETLIARARAMLDGLGGELVLRERVSAARLRRL
jgi:hypothetical protein